MKRSLIFFGLAAAVLMSAAVSITHAQQDNQPLLLRSYYKTIPLDKTKAERVKNAVTAAVATTQGLPMWSYSVTSPIDNNSYSGVMIGGDPFFNGARTTKIPTVIVPVIIALSDGTVYDPTVNDPCGSGGTTVAQVMGSPIFGSASYSLAGINIGTGQYVDEFQRANFYNANVEATGDSFHNILSPVTTLPGQRVTIPANVGQTTSFGSCRQIAVLDFSTFNSIIVNSLLPSLASQGVNAGTFPIFLIHNVVMGDPGTSVYSDCCIVGYHSATGSPVQTFAVADYDTTHLFSGDPDIAPLSHEVAEWMDDPLGTNLTPSWGNTGQVVGCQNNLEVGDPLTGSLYHQNGQFGVTMPSGNTYYPQQLAFYSWFYRQSPSLGVAGLNSNSGDFINTAGQICQ
jgi:hypothetical protein